MTKPAPPQQSSLNEMWNKKKARPAVKSKKEDVAMGDSEADTDGPSSSAPRASKAKAAPKVSEDAMEEDDAVAPSDAKGKAKAHEEDAMEEDQEPLQKPSAKKRRVVDSEDEEIPSSGKTKKSSSSTAKPASKLKPPPSKKSKPSPAPTTEDEDEPAPSDPRPAPVQPRDTAQQENEAENEDEGESEVDDDDDGAETSAAAKLAATKSAALPNVERKDVEWKDGQPIPYAALAHVFSLIEATTKRLEITSFLTAFFLLVIQRRKKDDADSLRQAVYLCINRLCPDFVGVELGIGESLLVKAIAESTGRKPKEVQADLKKEGDLGLVAMNSKNSQRLLFKPKPLTLPFEFSKLEEIAKTTGHAISNIGSYYG